MAKPVKHYGRWRIRWTDEHGKRHSLNFDTYSDAISDLRRRELEVDEIQRGYRAPRIVDKTFADLCDYWLTKRLPLKRHEAADRSIIKCHLLPAFAHLPSCLAGAPDWTRPSEKSGFRVCSLVESSYT